MNHDFHELWIIIWKKTQQNKHQKTTYQSIIIQGMETHKITNIKSLSVISLNGHG